MVEKYLVLCYFSCNKNSSGGNIPAICMRAILVYVLMFQVLTATVFYFNGSPDYVHLSGFLTTVSIVLFLCVFFCAEQSIGRMTELESADEDLMEVEEKLRENIYIHPVERYNLR